MATESVILVTGGSGLVGKAIQWVIENDTTERFGKKAGEKWVFLTSKMVISETPMIPRPSLKSTSLLTLSIWLLWLVVYSRT
ncbi:unnamed protein product [Absidia cylindrospora]